MPYGSRSVARTVDDMCCVECGREQTPEDRGWVTVLTPIDEPRLVYCPDCVIGLLRGALRDDERGDERPGGVSPLGPQPA